MSFVDSIRSFMHDPRIKGIDIDSVDILSAHRQVIDRKPMIKGVFLDFYKTCMQKRTKHSSCPPGQEIELGAGVSFFKEVLPSVVTTDIKPYPGVDRTLDAQAMALAGASVQAFYGINCFHHFPDPRAFFRELDRTLMPGGVCVLIEPYHNTLSSLLYPRIHKQESFNKLQKHWEATADTGPMSGANQALSYIVFERDRAVFEQEFPRLEISAKEVMSPSLRYLLSGGVNFRQCAPNALIPAIKWIEKLIVKITRSFAIHEVIVIRRKIDWGNTACKNSQ